MHSLFMVTPGMDCVLLNTFRGQAGQSLWESRGETARLSTGLAWTSQTLWENLGFYTPQSRSTYTGLPTSIFGIFTLLAQRFSTLSTGPIKRVTNLRKEIRS